MAKLSAIAIAGFDYSCIEVGGNGITAQRRCFGCKS
jgi:hypothetical protein